ncbi:uncharacterized protein LOC131628464 [Vicia villosa]|uniref:uncharacterized protein LOC131628464 n=1 Tax=Vicia villosa TaxID=3911 RepID=UPI00273B287D|nr:uncharacterized protein LOC131628464 [Vicia villosa]
MTVDMLWSPPGAGWIKCNIDGAVAGSTSLASCDGIFRDAQANHVISFSVFLGPGSSVFEEFMAAVLAIEKARHLNWTELWLETDCALLVKAFSDSSLVPWKIKSRWLTCWAYTLSIDFRIIHIFREANFCTDVLANIGLKRKSIATNFDMSSGFADGMCRSGFADANGIQ